MVDVLSLGSLPPRPPTPPRSSFQLSSFRDDPNALSALKPGQLPSPPDLSPHPHSDARKKVNFSPLPSYIKPLDLSHSGVKSLPSLRSLRPSNESKPPKSILKSKLDSPLCGGSEHSSPSPSKKELPVMLESVTQQLAGDSHASRSDAYTQLLGTLTAYRDVPNTDLLCDRVGVLTQFIRRDIAQAPSTSNAQAISLVRHALNLLSMFAWHSQLSTHISDDFKSFFLDHAINSLQVTYLPKSVAVDYMRALSVLTFPPKILVNGKVIQLLSVFKDIAVRVRGKAVLLLRLTIYEKLLCHSKTVFTSQASAWTDNVVTALFHEVAEIRIKAITLGFQVAVMVGPNNAISKAIQDTLDVSAENEPKFGEKLSSRLVAMISGRESGVQGVHIPQIWSVVILLLRRSRWSIEQWSLLKQWLLVIQKCFNCSDPAVKLQALVAWDRFVFAVQPNEPTASKGTVKLLCRPILSQLERKRTDKSSGLLTQAYASYYHLLYYAFRPSASHDRLDLFWKEYVVRFLSGTSVLAPDSHETACGILAALFWNSHPKIWPEGKPIDSSKLSPSDLPRLDFRWIRSRLSTILPVLETLFKTASWSEADLAESPVGIAWVNLSRCLAEASSKEIQPSHETMNAIGRILEMLQRVWRDVPGSLNASDGSDSFLTRFQFLLTTVISTIGSMPFTDKFISKTSNNTFQTVSTPSQRHPQGDGKSRPAVVHLLDLIRHSPHPLPHAACCDFFRNLIDVSLKGRTSRGSRLEILCQFADSLSEADTPPICPNYSKLAWMIIAEVTEKNLASTTQTNTPVRDRDSAAVRDYEKVKKILVAGTKYPYSATEWIRLLNSLVTTIQADKANGTVIPILEAISEELCSLPSTVPLPQFVALLDHTLAPNDATHTAKPFVPANKIPGSKPRQDAVPLEKTMALVTRALKETYEQVPSVNSQDILSLMEGIIRFVDRCPSTFHPTLLEKCQAGVALWLADGEDKITKTSFLDKNILVAVQSLLSKSLRMLETCESTDSALLGKLATFVASGLESRHKSTTNNFIRMWNVTFGLQRNLTYPAPVEKALRRLQPFINLQLPDLPGGAGSEDDPQPPEFLSSQEDGLNFDKTRNGASRHGKRRKKSSLVLNLSESATAGDDTPKAKPAGSRDVSTPKPRLRHDDSQVQFIPVDSSPVGPPETQVLTEHQREVRERQRIDSSRLFSDLQSSSANRRRDSIPSLAIPLLAQAQTDAPGTPQLPVAGVTNDDEVPLSSPTPGSKEQNAQLAELTAESSLPSLLEWNTSDLEPPSSPPQPNSKPPFGTFKVTSAGPKPRATERTGNMTRPNSEKRRSGFAATNEDSPLRTRLKRKDGQELDDEVSSADSVRKKKRKTGSAPVGEANNGSIAGESVHTTEPIIPAPLIAVEDQEMIDMVPDSFGDVLQQQIASQLEQDLELSMDNALAEGESTTRPVRQGKRKRGAMDLAHGREKRTTTKTNSPIAEISVSKLSSSPDVELQSFDSDDEESSKRAKPRRSPRKAKQTEPATTLTPPALKRRRSLRLRGEPVFDNAEDKVPEEAQESERNFRDSNASLAPGSDAPRASSPLEDRPTEDASSSNVTREHAAPQNTEVGGEERPSSPTSIMSSLRNILGSIKNMSFGKSTLREMDDVMFNIRMEAHDAVKRHDT